MLHPGVLGALALLLVNDHVLKRVAAGTAAAVLTGKLSDVAGLVFFPVLLWSVLEVMLAALRRPWGPSCAAAALAVVVTAATFALTKTWSAAAEVYRAALGLLQWPALAVLALVDGRPVSPPGSVLFVVDPTDLVALPAALVALALGRRRCRVTRRPEAPGGAVC